MSLKENVESWKKRLKLDGHHTMERFGIAAGAFVTTLAVIVGGTTITAMGNNAEKTAQTALYTPAFTTSKTNLSGKVEGVFVSEDRTRSFVLMSFDSSASAAISADASNYQAYLTAADTNLRQQVLAGDAAGSIVVFGTSGYMGVVLDGEAPFEQQILNLTLRANSELVYQKGDSGELRADLKNDASFQQYDQWRIYFNPGAGDAIEAVSLGGADESFSALDVYYELVVNPQEAEARDALEEDLAQLQVDLAKIAEYTAQMAVTEVGGVKIVPPDVPEQIDGDEVTGTKGAGDAAEQLMLHTDWVSERGYDFDWRAGSVRDGYLEALVPEGQTYVSFLAEKAQAQESSGAFSGTNLQWLLTDGSDLVADYRSSNVAMKPLLEVMNNLTQAYSTYYSDKVKYQTSSLEALIALEVSLTNVGSSSTTNNGDSALLTY